jgi:repressor LexA
MDDKKKKVISFYQAQKRMPSYREVAKMCGYASTQAAVRVVHKWMEEEFIEKDDTGRLIKGPSFSRLRVLGIVEAGFPTPAEEDHADTISLDEFLIDNKDASYMLKVKGDSMIDAGIQEGDFVIAERTHNPKVGEIVIAEVDQGWTMKYLRKNAKGYFLEAANENYKPIYPEEELKIAAVVKGVVRKY